VSKSVEALSAAGRVCHEVKESILSNRISGGELISEGEIAGQYHVSRTPVRKAFLRLESEGWMKLYPKRGALVLPIADDEAAEVVEARILLEGHAVRSIAGDRAAVDALVTALRANLDDQRGIDPADVAAFAKVDAEFHQLIAAAGRNRLLSGFYTSLGERHRRMTTASVHRRAGTHQRILDDHHELIAAIADADAAEFVAALDRHLLAVHGVGTGIGTRPSEGEQR